MTAKPAAPKAPKPAEPLPGVTHKDELFFHVDGKPSSGRVCAMGKDGVTVDHVGGRRRVKWGEVLGYKKRAAPGMKVVDAGEDGAILEDEGGRRVFAHGWEEPDQGDNLVDMDEKPREPGPMKKSILTILLFGSGEVMAKALKNAPGLSLQSVTDKKGNQTKRWKKTGEKPKGEPRPKAGDHVTFKTPEFEGPGEIVGKPGKHGVQIRDGAGKVHPVGWDKITGKAKAPKKAAKEKPAPAAAAEPAEPKASADAIAQNLFTADDTEGLTKEANQPTKDREELFLKSEDAIAHMKKWLNEGSGICDQLGFETMTKSPDDTPPEEWAKPGGMLFMGKIKGRDRAEEKVKADYGGDWSGLLDTVRATIAVDAMDEIKTVVDRLRAGGMELARLPKNRFVEPTEEGYRDLMLNIKFPNGIIGELQVHVKAMTAAKAEGHAHYKVARTIVAKHKRGKTMTFPETWPEEDNKAFWHAVDAQRKIYGDAWKKIAGDTDGGAE